MEKSNYSKQELEYIKNATSEDLASSILISHLADFNAETFDIFLVCRNMIFHLLRLMNDELVTEEQVGEIESHIQHLLKIYIGDLIKELAKKEAKELCK